MSGVTVMPGSSSIDLKQNLTIMEQWLGHCPFKCYCL